MRWIRDREILDDSSDFPILIEVFQAFRDDGILFVKIEGPGGRFGKPDGFLPAPVVVFDNLEAENVKCRFVAFDSPDVKGSVFVGDGVGDVPQSYDPVRDARPVDIGPTAENVLADCSA